MKGKIALILALAIGGLAALMLYQYLSDIQAKSVAAKETRAVVVAAKTIPARTRLDNSMVSIQVMPEAYAHPGALSDLTEVVGKISTTVIQAGEQVLTSKITDEKETSRGMAYTIAQGKRAISIAADEVIGVSGFLGPGDKVDVIAGVDLPDKNLTTMLVVQDVRVLAVGPYLERPTPDEPISEMKTVVLEVTPSEALQLLMADEAGHIRLLLRPAVAENKVNVRPYHIGQLGQ